ncbi:hypothetical protein VI06_16440 [Aquitalea magnusonii]|nr:hypothetical protein VI06_16440 [Aquitalea magnusonii]
MAMAASSLAMPMVLVIVIIPGSDSTTLLQSCQGQKDQNCSQVDHRGGGCLIKDHNAFALVCNSANIPLARPSQIVRFSQTKYDV